MAEPSSKVSFILASTQNFAVELQVWVLPRQRWDKSWCWYWGSKGRQRYVSVCPLAVGKVCLQGTEKWRNAVHLHQRECFLLHWQVLQRLCQWSIFRRQVPRLAYTGKEEDPVIVTRTCLLLFVREEGGEELPCAGGHKLVWCFWLYHLHHLWGVHYDGSVMR